MAQLFMRDPRFASKVFKTQDRNLTRLPRPRFLYFVRFQPSGGIRPETDFSVRNSFNDIETGISFLAKMVDRPKLRFSTETLNQYNKKRVIQTKVEYQPVRIQFYDTADDRVIQAFISYFRWYYGDPRANSTFLWDRDSVESMFDPINPEETGSDMNVWPGFNPTQIPNIKAGTVEEVIGQGRYFSYIDIFTFGGNMLTGYRLINPVINSFDPDEMDATSNDVTTVSITLDYEAVIWPKELGPQLSIAPVPGTSGPNTGNEFTALFQNGENAMAKNSAFLPPEQSVQISDYFPFKNPEIDKPISDEAIAGFNRFRPQLNSNVKQPVPTRVQQTRGTSVFGGLNFGAVTGNAQARPVQPGTIDGPSSTGIPVLDLPRNVFSTFGGTSSAFNVPGTTEVTNAAIPIGNDLTFQTDLPAQNIKYINQQQTSGTNGLWFDHARALIQTLGFTSPPIVNALAQSLIESSEVYGISPTEIVRGFAATNKVDPSLLGMISVANINQTRDPSVQLGALGSGQYDYSWNTQLQAGSPFAGYNSQGQPVNASGQRIDGLGRAVDVNGNPIVNVSPENQPKTVVGPQLNQTIWANNSTTTDSANLAAMVLNKNV